MTEQKDKPMTTLNCDDGTIVQINKETEKQLRREFELEPTFKVGDIFWRDEPSGYSNHYLQLRADKGNGVALYNTQLDIALYLYIVVKDINAITFAEVRRMTRYPEGLRHVKRFKVEGVN